MTLDTVTLMAMASFAMIVCAISFILNTSFTRSDPTGRMWSLGFISGITVAAGYGIEAAVPDAWWGLVVGNVAYIGTIGALWCGARLHNGRSSLIWVVGILGLGVAVVTLVMYPRDGTWAGAAILWIGLAGLSVIGGIELQRGRLRRNVNGRSLGLILWIVAIFLAARALVYVTTGPDRPPFTTFFNGGVAAVVLLALTISAAITVSVLRAERGGGSAVGDLSVGIHSRAGVLSAESFSQAAIDHLERASAGNTGVALIGADVDRLPEMNTAFGRTAGDDAISAFAQTLRGAAPVMAVLGHPSAGRFLVLVTVVSSAEARTIAEHIQLALVDNPLPGTQQIRLTASFGVADSFDHGYPIESLTSAVFDAIDRVKASGGNAIEVAHA